MQVETLYSGGVILYAAVTTATLADIAANVRALMEQRRMSASDLARRSGVSPKTVNNIVNGRHGTQVDNLFRIAAALGADPWQLMMPGFPPDAATDDSFGELVEVVATLPREARARVAHMAELERKVSGK